MKDLASNASTNASQKFEVYTMSCGDISDFHEGLSRLDGEVLRHLLRYMQCVTTILLENTIGCGCCCGHIKFQHLFAVDVFLLI